MHTPLCKHARGEPEDYALAAQRRGLTGIVVTCHNPTDDGWSPHVRMAREQFDEYVAMVARARASWAGTVDVRLGMESDYVPGMEPWLERLHSRASFHHVLGSVHPHLADYKRRFQTGSYRQFQATYFEHLALAAETGLFDTLAHPDLIKNESPEQWNVEHARDLICRCLDRVAATGTAMELNTSGLLKPLREMNPSLAMLTEMCARGIPVVMGADAHDPHRVAARFETALDLLAKAGYAHTSIFLDRQRRDIPLTEARAQLRRVGAMEPA